MATSSAPMNALVEEAVASRPSVRSRLTRAIAALGTALVVVASGSTFASAAWSTTTVDSFGNAHTPSTSLAISPGGRTFVAFTRGGNDLFWSQKTSRGWDSREVVGDDSYVSCYEGDWQSAGPSAAFTADGSPHIASACAAFTGGSKVLYTTRGRQGWSTRKVGFGPSAQSYESSATSLALAMSAGGRPHIVMTDAGTLDIVRFLRVDGRWQRQTLMDGAHICCGGPQFELLDAAFDPLSGRLAIATVHYAPFGTDLFFAEFNGLGEMSDFASIPLQGQNAYGRPSLAFPPNGDPAIAFQMGTDASKSLAFAMRTAGEWSVVPVDDSVADIGAHPSLEIDDGTFHVAYPDESNDDLKYASSTNGSAWAVQTVAVSGDLGEYPSIEIASSGQVRISHYDRGGAGVKATFGS